jgi:CDP-paratose 2-epimerase
VTLAIVTGSAGLIGSETVRFLHEKGLDVIGVDNNLREYFFGQDGSTRWQADRLVRSLPRYRHLDADIRDQDRMLDLFQLHKPALVVHCAAQPSHDWAAREPMTDFTVNAHGTMILLEATRRHAPDAVFISSPQTKSTVILRTPSHWSNWRRGGNRTGATDTRNMALMNR